MEPVQLCTSHHQQRVDNSHFLVRDELRVRERPIAKRTNRKEASVRRKHPKRLDTETGPMEAVCKRKLGVHNNEKDILRII